MDVDKGSEDKKNMINSLIRAINILELYDQHKSELGITEIATQLNLYKSTVYRIVSTLEYKGILKKNPENGKYKLGFKLYRLGVLARNENELIAVSQQHLKRLTELSGETANLVVMDGTMSVYVAQQTSNKIIKMFTKIGAKIFPHCNGAGKVLLSGMDEEEINQIISKNGLPSYTKNTITKKEELIEELKKIRANGYALDNEEREEGVMCIAAPIKDKSKKIIAAISISGPKYRFNPKINKELISIVKKEAAIISHKLGYKP